MTQIYLSNSIFTSTSIFKSTGFLTSISTIIVDRVARLL